MSNRQIHIAVDAMGGDNSPFKTLKGSEMFSIHNKNVKLLFFGNSEEIKEIIKVNKLNLSNYDIVDCKENVSDEDKSIGIKPCNIFDPFKGKSLRLQINTVGTNWNYNGTVTLSEAGPLLFNGSELTPDKKTEFVEF